MHLLQVVESEKTAKWQYSQQCEELTAEIKKLRNEVIYCFLLSTLNLFSILSFFSCVDSQSTERIFKTTVDLRKPTFAS